MNSFIPPHRFLCKNCVVHTDGTVDTSSLLFDQGHRRLCLYQMIEICSLTTTYPQLKQIQPHLQIQLRCFNADLIFICFISLFYRPTAVICMSSSNCVFAICSSCRICTVIHTFPRVAEPIINRFRLSHGQ